MHKNTYRMLCIGACIMCIAAAWGYYRYMHNYVSLEFLQEKASYLRTVVSLHYLFSLGIYGLFYCAMVVAGLPATGLLTLLGGFLFGAIPAFLCSMLSILIGVSISFGLIRTFFVRTLRVKFAKKQAQFTLRMKQYGVSYLITLNLLTVIPFFLINTLAALSGIPLWSLLWTTAVGSTPILIVYACAGKKFAEINSISEIFSPSLIIMFMILVSVSFIPLVMKRMRYINDLDE